ncbi:hypothetical protein [Bradyrhizobium sp.]|uniref:hypothetical protein n=1 Tax=Bradyrhizobium sp. TaxID=376 RepID=UPI0023A25D61|nr:hypothetical protein [Bradyrhizobium sp.]MDE1934920.1 hypothetical protein [Bradyrhizobium sp.]
MRETPLRQRQADHYTGSRGGASSFMQSNRNRHFVHPALVSFADECCAALAQLIAYVGALTLFTIAGLHFWDQLQFEDAADPAVANPIDLDEKSGGYGPTPDPAGCREINRLWATPSDGRADLNSRGCGTATALSADWVTGTENPRLRGSL